MLKKKFLFFKFNSSIYNSNSCKSSSSTILCELENVHSDQSLS